MNTGPIRTLVLAGVLCLVGARVTAAEQPAAEEPAGSEEAPASGAMSTAHPGQGEEKEPTLSEVLAGPSGVRVATMCTNCNVASVSMFGQSGDRVQVWQDGLPVMGGLGAIYLLSVVPSGAIVKTDVVRGSGTVLTGSEAGVGAVQLQTRIPKKEPYLSISGDAGSLDWRSLKFLGAATWGKLGGQLALTKSSSGPSDPNEDGVNDLAAFKRHTIAGTVSWQLGKSSYLRFDALDYEEDQEDGRGGWWPPLQTFLKEDIEISRHMYSLGWNQTFSDGSLLSMRLLTAKRSQYTFDSEEDVPQPYMRVFEEADEFEARYQRTFASKHVLTVGATKRDFEVDGKEEKGTVIQPSGQHIIDNIHHKGGYAEVNLSLPARLDLTAGVRYDDYGDSDSRTLTFDFSSFQDVWVYEKSALGAAWLPRLRLGWKATPTLSLSLSAGKAFAPPRPIFERVCCGAQVFSNAGVRPEISRNLLFDSEWVPEDWLRLRLALFKSKVEDYLQKLVWFSFPNFIPSYFNANYERVDTEGFEVALETLFWRKLSFGATYTQARIEAEDPEISLTVFGQTLPVLQLPEGQVPQVPEKTGMAFIRWEDKDRGYMVGFDGQYTGTQTIQKLENPFGFASFWEPTPSFWVYNFRFKARLYKWFSVYGGVDNIDNYFQLWLDDPRYEYNWGPLRGRYYYFGLTYEY